MFFNTLKKERAHSHELLSHELEKMRTPIECIIQSVLKKKCSYSCISLHRGSICESDEGLLC